MIRGGNATIYVSDMQRAVDFYHNTLELPLVFQPTITGPNSTPAAGCISVCIPHPDAAPHQEPRAGPPWVSRSMNRSHR